MADGLQLSFMSFISTSGESDFSLTMTLPLWLVKKRRRCKDLMPTYLFTRKEVQLYVGAMMVPSIFLTACAMLTVEELLTMLMRSGKPPTFVHQYLCMKFKICMTS